MIGLDLNQPILYRHASLRFFEEKECHITRRCKDDVLLLVFQGTLRFREAGIDRAVHAGEYYIQQAGLLQEGVTASDAPRYLYVHFQGKWSENASCLPISGAFSYTRLKNTIDRLDRISRNKLPYAAKAGCFYELLSSLYETSHKDNLARQIGQYIEENLLHIDNLDTLCRQFHYSKNHIINVMAKEYGMTPIEFINDAKLHRAMYLLEVTSRPAQQVAEESGFHNYSHFYRQFWKKTGLSPTDWRKKVLLQPVTE